MRHFLSELYRRNVVRSTSLYLALAWVLMELSHLLDHFMGISGTTQRYLMVFLTIGFIPVVLFSWRYELTDHGLEDEERLPQPKAIHHPMATRQDWWTIMLLLFAYLLTLVDQFAIEPYSPHRYEPMGIAAPDHEPTTP